MVKTQKITPIGIIQLSQRSLGKKLRPRPGIKRAEATGPELNWQTRARLILEKIKGDFGFFKSFIGESDFFEESPELPDPHCLYAYFKRQSNLEIEEEGEGVKEIKASPITAIDADTLKAKYMEEFINEIHPRVWDLLKSSGVSMEGIQILLKIFPDCYPLIPGGKDYVLRGSYFLVVVGKPLVIRNWLNHRAITEKEVEDFQNFGELWNLPSFDLDENKGPQIQTAVFI